MCRGAIRTLKSARTNKRNHKRGFATRVGIARDEKRLVSNLIAAIEKKAGSKENVIVALELDCFQGVADVVAGTYNGYRLLPNSSGDKLHLLSFSTSKILSALAGKRKSSIPKILQATGLSAPTIRKELILLQKLGIVRPGNGDRVSILHVIRPPFREIEAYEVKVKDWKGGIYQARNYKSFAHKVSVALPLKRASLLKKKLPDFRRMRVGLLGIGPTGKLKWFLKPRRQRPISGPRNYLAAISLLRGARKRGS